MSKKQTDSVICLSYFTPDSFMIKKSGGILMSVENNLRLSMLKTALFHQLKNHKKSPERTARNIEEILQLFAKVDPDKQDGLPGHKELLDLLQTHSREDCLDLILHYFAEKGS